MCVYSCTYLYHPPILLIAVLCFLWGIIPPPSSQDMSFNLETPRMQHKIMTEGPILALVGGLKKVMLFLSLPITVPKTLDIPGDRLQPLLKSKRKRWPCRYGLQSIRGHRDVSSSLLIQNRHRETQLIGSRV